MVQTMDVWILYFTTRQETMAEEMLTCFYVQRKEIKVDHFLFPGLGNIQTHDVTGVFTPPHFLIFSFPLCLLEY